MKCKDQRRGASAPRCFSCQLQARKTASELPAHTKGRGMETNVIIVDRISNIAVSNGILRIECVAVNAAGQEKPSGTVLIPGIVAGQVIQSLVNAMQDLEKKLREGAGGAAPAGKPS